MSKKSVLILRCCGPNGESSHGFVYPTKVGAVVTAPDWDPKPECGNGLHGWANGQGNLSVGGSKVEQSDSLWLVIEAKVSDVVELDSKVKFRTGKIRFVGERCKAANYLAGKVSNPVHFACVTAGVDGTATAGDYGTATAGVRGTATAGDYGTATAGDYGTATAGDYGTATAGVGGNATAGDYGTATAGYGGTISILFYDSKMGSYRRRCTEIKGKIRPNVPYILDSNGKFIQKV